MLLKRAKKRTAVGLSLVIVLSLCFLYLGNGVLGTFSPFRSRSSTGFLVQDPSEELISSPSETNQSTDGELSSIYEEDFREDETSLKSGNTAGDAAGKEPSEDFGKEPSGGAYDEISHTPEADEQDGDYSPLPDSIDYREIFSLSTTDRKFISLFTGGGVNVYNPNLIPHPSQHDVWIVVAQHEQSGQDITVSEEMTCNVGLLNDAMVCTAEPSVLPVEPSIQGQCDDEHSYFNFRLGPRDARMFYGPDAPYILYGSQSAHGCLGIWLEDVRMLLQDFHHEQTVLPKLFTHATEVQRPPPVRMMDKNFFLFWDSQGKAYVHHDIYPRRTFAQISFDGSVGPDLASLAYSKDNVCLETYMPTVGPSDESIHQATNSLSITLCKRKDPDCVINESNTFIFTIFQYKTYHDYHGIYEPYVMVFQRDPPFAIHAISQRPLWIHGRAALAVETHSLQYEGRPDEDIPGGHTEMFYVTSISWKTHGQKYHGYMDDPLFLSFGIEDTRAGFIDVLAEDLFQDLVHCT